MTVKTVIFWIITPYSLLGSYQRFWGTCCIHIQGMLLITWNGGSRFLWNIGDDLPDYKVAYPARRQNKRVPVLEKHIIVNILLSWSLYTLYKSFEEVLWAHVSDGLPVSSQAGWWFWKMFAMESLCYKLLGMCYSILFQTQTCSLFVAVISVFVVVRNLCSWKGHSGTLLVGQNI
jgi:hypothetical protein